MNYLSRIPVWFWYLFSVAYCYVLWNPGFSLFHLLMSNVDPAIKVIGVLLCLAIGSVYVIEGHRTLNVFGIILFFALFGAIFWLASNMGIHQAHSAQWWGQWVVGLLLTIALQGGRIYRGITGRIPIGGTVDDGDEAHHHH